MEYRASVEVERTAREIMEKHHELLDRKGPRIVYLLTKPSKLGGKEPRWKLRRVTGLNAFLSAGVDGLPDRFLHTEQSLVVLEVSQFFWNTLDEDQRRGFLDHALSHLDYDKDAWSIEGPEFGEFPGVLERHGDWRPEDSFKKFATRLSMQPSLLLGLEDEEGEEGEEAGEAADGQEVLDVSITHKGRTVHTDTETMRKLAEGDFVAGPNGEKVDAETGEVLEGVRS
jgi:hypothetical protein